ncbi:hypothetical protein MU448_04605 [Streptococcus sp. O1]|nr:hypothetical protein [Streptococcus sp. O1]
MNRQEESLYEVRLCLFGIPLWKIKRIKRELRMYVAMTSNKKKIIELKFIEEEKNGNRNL